MARRSAVAWQHSSRQREPRLGLLRLLHFIPRIAAYVGGKRHELPHGAIAVSAAGKTSKRNVAGTDEFRRLWLFHQ
jgi:hypothetical protein